MPGIATDVSCPPPQKRGLKIQSWLQFVNLKHVKWLPCSTLPLAMALQYGFEATELASALERDMNVLTRWGDGLVTATIAILEEKNKGWWRRVRFCKIRHG